MSDQIAQVQQGVIAIPADLSTDDHSIFHLPSEVEGDERMERIYREVVAGLRREAADIPMTTVQHLLIERLASLFVTIKYHEENGTFLPRQQREYNQQFLMMGAEFNKLLLASQDMRQVATMEKIRSAVITAANRLPDPEMRTKMKDFLIEEFQKAGL